QKVAISGGGRCNVTHNCMDPMALATHYPRGNKALIGPFHRFGPQDTMAWFESRGVPLKTESDGRVFPVSNQSLCIVTALKDAATCAGVTIWTSCGVRNITKSGNIFSLTLQNHQILHAHKVVLATGGSRAGHKLAQGLGHQIVSPIPSLFSFNVADPTWHRLQGLSVPHVRVWLRDKKKHPTEGPLLATHWGMSGPAIIKLSAWQARFLNDQGYKCPFMVHFLPELTPNECQNQLQTWAQAHPNKRCITQSPFLSLPKRIWQYLVQRALNDDTIIWKQCQSIHYNNLVQHVTQCPFNITGRGQFKDEFVTCGGVALKEVNFKTMESRCCKGLHLVGEILDSDGVTGGFNFQHAWTTGYLSATGN
ncbi:MAG: NAD(P)/FAD-dependent oxidoreductase, partial [Candidatus Marinamargulisbacteria bacterium]